MSFEEQATQTEIFSSQQQQEENLEEQDVVRVHGNCTHPADEEPNRMSARTVSKKNETDTRFSCSICFESVVEPVVTACGHLYCWPCLYRWLEPGMLAGERESLLHPDRGHSTAGALYQHPAADPSRRVCPVCKSPCSVPTVIPIYVRTEEEAGVVVVHSSSTSVKSDNNFIDDEESSISSHQNEPEATRASPSEENQVADNPSSPEREQSDEAVPSTTTEPSPPFPTGLRQRLRFRSRDSEIPIHSIYAQPSQESSVPARPTANSNYQSPPRAQVGDASSPGNMRGLGDTNSSRWITPLSPMNRASLSHGLVLSFQQAFGAHPQGTVHSSYVPPLHNYGNNHNNNPHNRASRDSTTGVHSYYSSSGTTRSNHNNLSYEPDDAAENAPMDPYGTEFLSRILLMLGSFVLLCLLLF